MEMKIMDLHLIDGEKGGVGKSFVTRTLAQYCDDRAFDYALFDADRSNPDVKRIYKKRCQSAIFSENEKLEEQANPIYNSAVKKRTIVNLPAQISTPFKAWFEDNSLIELAVEDRVKIVIWFVCSGGYDSLKLLSDRLAYFGNKLDLVLVKNWGICDDWECIDDNEILGKQINDSRVITLDFPKFKGNLVRNRIDSESLTFGAVRSSKKFSSIDRQRVKSFLNNAYGEFDKSKLFPEYNRVEVSAS